MIKIERYAECSGSYERKQRFVKRIEDRLNTIEDTGGTIITAAIKESDSHSSISAFITWRSN
jgi:hypothetical protein